MDAIHDLGGKQGYGAVVREDDEPVFHQRWEAAVFTMSRTAQAVGALNNTDQFRHAVERIDPVAYLSHGYYGRWLGALENLFTEAGTIETARLNDKVVGLGGNPADLVAAQPDPNKARLAASFPAQESEGAARTIDGPPAFVIGQRVKTAAVPVSGHTRLPAYARNRVGVVVALQGGWVLPDTNA
ncbi:MAG: SH3-like domain-containing protein, partial [Pseudomonadales bacterium]